MIFVFIVDNLPNRKRKNGKRTTLVHAGVEPQTSRSVTKNQRPRPLGYTNQNGNVFSGENSGFMKKLSTSCREFQGEHFISLHGENPSTNKKVITKRKTVKKSIFGPKCSKKIWREFLISQTILKQ